LPKPVEDTRYRMKACYGCGGNAREQSRFLSSISCVVPRNVMFAARGGL